MLAGAGGASLERCLDVVRYRGRVAYANGIEPPAHRAGIDVIAYDVSGPHKLDGLARRSRTRTCAC